MGFCETINEGEKENKESNIEKNFKDWGNWVSTVKGKNDEQEVGGGEKGHFLCWGGICNQAFTRG